MSLRRLFFTSISLILCNTTCAVMGADLRKNLILFVNGFGGSPTDTWISSKSSESWIQMVGSDIDLSSFTAKPFEYPSGCREGKFIIENLAEPLTKELTEQSKRFENIYIIAHSMGGSLTLAALDNLWRDDKDIFDKVKGVVLCGVPFQGLEETVWQKLARIFCSSKNIKELNAQRNISYLTKLEKDWQSITHRKPRPYPRFYNYYESEPDFGIDPIATPMNQFQHAYNVTLVPGKNHRSLVKPDSRDDAIYKWVKMDILETESAVVAEKKSTEDLEKQVQEQNKNKMRMIAVRLGLPPVTIYTEEPHGRYKCFDYELFDLTGEKGTKLFFSNERSSPVVTFRFSYDTADGSIVMSYDDLKFNWENKKSDFEQRLDFLRFDKALSLGARIVFWDLRRKEVFLRTEKTQSVNMVYDWLKAESEINTLKKIVHIERKFVKHFPLQKSLGTDSVQTINYIARALNNEPINWGNEYVQPLSDVEPGPAAFTSFQQVNFNGIEYQVKGEKDLQTIFGEEIDLGPWIINVPSATANVGLYTPVNGNGKEVSALIIKAKEPTDCILLHHNIYFERNEVDQEPKRTRIDVIKDIFNVRKVREKSVK